LAEQSAAYQARTVQTGHVVVPEETAAARSLRGEYVLNADYLVRPPGGAEDLWMRVSAVPVRDANGLQDGAVAIFVDVTRERKLVEELASNVAANARLARELADRQHRLYDKLRAAWPASRSEPPILATLSERELQVLRLVARGDTNRMIGAALGISAGTVRNHVEHILAKLSVADRTQASVRASELGLIEPQVRP
jgi:DNA-binding CsgD family transcriptional regulator